MSKKIVGYAALVVLLGLTGCATTVTPMQAKNMTCDELAQAAEKYTSTESTLTNAAAQQATSMAGNSTVSALSGGLNSDAKDQANYKVVTDEWNSRCKTASKSTKKTKK
jgi:hypothetical protein